MTKVLSRRNFIGSGAVAAAALAASSNVFASAEERPSAEHASPIRLGLASYTFRNFTRAQTIGFMKQLNVRDLNAKDVKDHLPTDPAGGSRSAGGLFRRGHQAARRGHHLFCQG